jgi:hypothetical protein
MGMVDDYLARKLDRHYQGDPRFVGDTFPDDSGVPVDEWGNPDPNGQPPGMDYSRQRPPPQPASFLDALLGEVTRRPADPRDDERTDPRRRQQARPGFWQQMDERWQRGRNSGHTCYAIGCGCPNNFWRGRG